MVGTSPWVSFGVVVLFVFEIALEFSFCGSSCHCWAFLQPPPQPPHQQHRQFPWSKNLKPIVVPSRRDIKSLQHFEMASTGANGEESVVTASKIRTTATKQPMNHTEQGNRDDCNDNGPSSGFGSLQRYVESLSEREDGASETTTKFTCRLVPVQDDTTDDPFDIRTITTGDNNSTVVTEINTIVFRPLETEKEGKFPGDAAESVYTVAILPSSETVDVRRFSEELQRLDSGRYPRWELAPPDTVQALCGFEPGTIPPLLVGTKKRPWATLVDSALWQRNATISGETHLLVGGGGHRGHRCVLDAEFFLKNVLELDAPGSSSGRPNVRLASIARFHGGMEPNGATKTIPSSPRNQATATVIPTEKPFFQIAPPANSLGAPLSQQPHRPVPVTALGRLLSVRQIAKRLVFADFGPPTMEHRHDRHPHHAGDPPWRSGEDGQAMHVQIIVGKTFCEQHEDGTRRLKSLKPGRLVLVRGAANVDPMQKNGWRNSAGNWAQKRSLDVIVSSFQLIDEIEDDNGLERLVEEARNEVASRGRTESDNQKWNRLLPWDRKLDFERRAIEGSGVVTNGASSPEKNSLDRSMPASPNNDTDNPTNFLTMDQFNAQLRDKPLEIHVVDTEESIRSMASSISELFSKIDEEDQEPRNVLDHVAGIDCEWRPHGAYAEALLEAPEDHPVALLQICLPAIGRVYLVDAHRTLRASLADTEAMTGSEATLAEAIGTIFRSNRMIKVGYNVASDFRRLAASFPHVPFFRTVRSVVELSALAQKLHPKSAQPWLGSLQRLTRLVLGHTISKDEQCSDWEARPLTPGQIEYAALDCALPPRLLDEMAEGAGNAMIKGALPSVTKSYRFQTIDGSRKDAIRRLKAKRVVGNTFVVTQKWSDQAPEPNPPSLPEEGGGPYTDGSGTTRMPAELVSIGGSGRTHWEAMAGQVVGKKGSCIGLLVGNAVPRDAVLDYDPRSGFVSFRDGLALFVNLPDPRRPSSRKRILYPNEWLDDGRVLTWFIRENDWENGGSDTAKLLLGTNSDSMPSSVVLFARVGTGDFVCCGSCSVSEAKNDPLPAKSKKKLVKLNLHLNEWENMRDRTPYSQLLGAKKAHRSTSFEDDVARAVLEGNIIGAFTMALDKANANPSERSIESGRDCVKAVLSNSNNAIALEALEIIEKLV